MSPTFYENVEKIDAIISKPKLSNSDVELLKELLNNDIYQQYFFRTFKRADIFDQINKIVTFENVSGMQPVIQGEKTYFNPWWAGLYLINVADQIPSKIANIVTKIKSDNYFVIGDCMKAVLNMPVSVSRTLISVIDKWFDTKHGGLIDHLSVDLLQKFISENQHTAALELFSILTKIVPGRDGRGSFRYETYYYQELKTKVLPKLLELEPEKILEITENELKQAIRVDERELKKDFSNIWRPAIEPHEQNWDHEDVKDILTDVVRDSLEALGKRNSEIHREIVEKYFKEELSIFQRLAIHALRVTEGNEDLVKKVLNNPDYLFGDHEFSHEYIMLANSKVNTLSLNDRESFFKRVLEGPPKDSYKNATDEVFKKYRLYKIRDMLASLSPVVQDRHDLAEQLQKLEMELGKAENPDIENRHSSWIGPTSPLNKEAISRMAPEEFLEYVTLKFKPEKDHWEPSPSPEGLSRIFEEVVSSNPEPWAKIARSFYDPGKVYPAYISGLILGLDKACKEKKSFSLDPVLDLSECLVNTIGAEFDKEPETKRDKFDFGAFDWTRGALGNILESIVTTEIISISVGQMKKIKTILFSLAGSDPDPSEEDEKKYGAGKDFITYCINHNRGKAMRALMQYSLRWARSFRPALEIAAEKGKGTFPPGPSRMERDLKQFVTDRLQAETSPSVQSTYGYFLPFLFYLDQEWVKEMRKIGNLFPRDPAREQLWKAHWVGYVSYSRFFVELFNLFRQEYEIAIQQLEPVKMEKYKPSEQHKFRLAEHLMIAHYYYDNQCKPYNLLTEFFKKADEDARAHAIGFLGDLFKDDEEAKNKESCLKKWSLLKGIWEMRQDVKDYECTAFVRWLEFIPEPIDQVEKLIKACIPYVHRGRQEEKLLEYVDKNIETHTLESLRLLVELLKSKESLANLHFRLDLMQHILEKAKAKPSHKSITNLINQAINRLGEMGYYDFRKLLITP